MNHPSRNSSPRAGSKTIPGAVPLLFSAPEKSFLNPALIPAPTGLFLPAWPLAAINASPLTKNQLRKYPTSKKQNATCLTPLPGSFNHG
jgi:hypothetical protein